MPPAVLRGLRSLPSGHRLYPPKWSSGSNQHPSFPVTHFTQPRPRLASCVSTPVPADFGLKLCVWGILAIPGGWGAQPRSSSSLVAITAPCFQPLGWLVTPRQAPCFPTSVTVISVSTLEKRFFNLQAQLIYPSRFDSGDRETPEAFPSVEGLICLTI